MLQKLDSIRDQRFDVHTYIRTHVYFTSPWCFHSEIYVRDMFKEQHEVLLDVLRNSLVSVTGDLQRVLQAFYEFKSIVNNMDVIGERLLKKIEENTPLLRHSKRLFSKSPQNQKFWSSFALISVLVLLMGNWERK